MWAFYDGRTGGDVRLGFRQRQRDRRARFNAMRLVRVSEQTSLCDAHELGSGGMGGGVARDRGALRAERRAEGPACRPHPAPLRVQRFEQEGTAR